MRKVFKAKTSTLVFENQNGEQKEYTLRELPLAWEGEYVKAFFDLDVPLEDPSLLSLIDRAGRKVAEMISRFILPGYGVDDILREFTPSQMQQLFEEQEHLNNFSQRFEMIMNSMAAQVAAQAAAQESPVKRNGAAQVAAHEQQRSPAPPPELPPAPVLDPSPAIPPTSAQKSETRLPWWKRLFTFGR